MNDTPTRRSFFGRFLTRKWLARALFAAACLATLVAIFYLVENWRGRRAWTRFQAEAQAKGERLNPADFIPPQVSADQNFALTPSLAPLFDFLPGTQQWRDTNAVNHIMDFAPRFSDAMNRVRPERRPVNSWINVRTDPRQLYAAYSQTNSPPTTDEMLPPPGTTSAPAPSGETTAEIAGEPSAGTNVSIEVAAAGVLEALAEAGPLLEELQTAGRRPYSRFNIQYDADPHRILLPHLAPLRKVASILQVRASAQLAIGRPQEACEDIVQIFHMSNALRHEPFLISYLVRVAQLQFAIKTIAEGLEQQRWSDAHLAAFQKELARPDLLKEGRAALEAERAFNGELIDRIRRISDRWTMLSELSAPMDPVSLPNAWQRLLANAIPDGWFYFERANYSRMFQDYLLPPLKIEERRVGVALCNRNDQLISATINRSGPALFVRHYALSRILLPAGSKAIQRMALGQTGLDITGLACALERYRLAQGKYPDALDALVPQYVARLPHDVIDGKPLRYRLKENGRFVLYSVGWNQTDDGGKLARGRSDKTTDPSQGDWVW